MIVVGIGPGATLQGGRYNPATNTWSALNMTNAPATRTGFALVWTGTEMILWGGGNTGIGNATGGRFNPATNTWTATSMTHVPPGRSNPGVVWTGSEMIVFGGADNGVYPAVNARYNPSTNTWTTISSEGCPVPPRRPHRRLGWLPDDRVGRRDRRPRLPEQRRPLFSGRRQVDPISRPPERPPRARTRPPSGLEPHCCCGAGSIPTAPSMNTFTYTPIPGVLLLLASLDRARPRTAGSSLPIATMKALIILILTSSTLLAEPPRFAITKSTIDSGGNLSQSTTGSREDPPRFTLTGTIGQPDAARTHGFSAGGRFALSPGFWSEYTVDPDPRSPAARHPQRSKRIRGARLARRASEASSCSKSPDLTPESWTDVTLPVVDTATEHTVTVPIGEPRLFFRLKSL
jgi:hypothetical protein